VQIVCWTPFAILCIWTTIFNADTLNIYFTLSAPLIAKVVLKQEQAFV
jgi:hypothetical protein